MSEGSKGLGAERVRELARAGAEALLRQLQAEIAAIESTFPELAGSRRRADAKPSVQRAHKQTRTMSEAGRKAVSARMKRYWAARRRARAKAADVKAKVVDTKAKAPAKSK